MMCIYIYIQPGIRNTNSDVCDCSGYLNNNVGAAVLPVQGSVFRVGVFGLLGLKA